MVSTCLSHNGVKKQEKRGLYSAVFSRIPAFANFPDRFWKTGHILKPAPDAVLRELSTFPR
jgi:hypothetical protein